jgi:oligoendopeptidase F
MYMMQNQLYDVSDSAVKMDSGFTTYISDYHAPFIFSKWTGSADDIATMLHELGHYANYYYNAAVGNSTGENLDLAEVDSQALVLLLFDQYDNFYGKHADEARSATLIDAMFSLLSGCMEDEFQQDVYETPDMTLDQINALYKKLAVEYGLDEVYGYQGTEWVQIPHTFQMPFYYISYAVSMVPALELLELSRSDKDAAQTAYFNIMMRAQYANLGDVLSQNGLGNVFSEDTIAGIAEILKAYLKN